MGSCFHFPSQINAHWGGCGVCQCLSAQQAKVRPWVFLVFLWAFLTPCCECRGKKSLANKTSFACNMLWFRQDELDYRHKPREGPWMSVTSSFCLSLSNHLIPGFFGKRPKKKEDIISIQFVRSLCKRTDRLSYFGHTPRGELWGTGGRGVDKRPFPFTPDCYWPFEPQENQPRVSAREDFTEHMTDEECSQQQH